MSVLAVFFHQNRGTMDKLSEKYLLTVKEAVQYFGLSRTVFYDMAKDTGNKYILHNGRNIYIKRKLFEEFLDKSYYA